jgi:type VI secretion system protein ImpH
MLSPLHAKLAHAPHRFGFFEALRRVQQAEPQKPRIGTSARPAEDALRLGQPPSLAFAASTLASFECRDDGKPPRMQVNAFGLFGPSGPLPSHLTEYAHERQHNAGDPTFARFADVFHHRMLSLFFRAWATPEPAVDMDRPQSSQYMAQIGALIGIGLPVLRNRDAMPDDAKLHHAGHLANQTRNAEGLQAMVADLFGLPVAIEQFVGEWIELPADGQCRVGGDQGNAGPPQVSLLPLGGADAARRPWGRSESASQLGINTLLGQRTWCAQHKFRLRLGPMAWADYQRFLPGKAALTQLQAVVRNVLGDELAWDLELVLKQPEVPAAQLCATHQLGWSMWLGQRPVPADACDLKLDPCAHGSTTQPH